LFEQLRAEAQSAAATLRVPPKAAHRLPAPLTRLFGREQEIEQLQALLLPAPGSRAARERLVTLTGPGGSGKTRLALAVSRQLREPLHDAVWFVPLQDLLDSRLLVDRLLDGLQLTRSSNVEPLEQVEIKLSGQRSLLVLDNFEHLLE